MSNCLITICQLFLPIFFCLVAAAIFSSVIVATSDLTTSTVASPAVDAKSVAEVNDILEDIFLITLNKGWLYFLHSRKCAK